MTEYYRATVPVEGKDGETWFRQVGALFPAKEGSKTAFRLVLDFPVGATEFVFFDPKEKAPDGEG